MSEAIRSPVGTLRPSALLPLSAPRIEAAAIVGLCPILLAVALWNGFPIIYYDTGAYMLEGLGHVFLPERSSVYSHFLLLGGAGISFWLIAVLQAAMTSFVLVETVKVSVPRAGLFTALGIGAALCALTGICWYVDQIEPDCFAAIAILACWLLAFHDQALGKLRAGLLVAIAALAAAAHSSHLGIVAGLILCIWGARLVGRHWRLALPRGRLTLPVASLVLAIALVLASNFALAHAFFLSRSAPVFITARLMQDGIVKRLLDDTCPQSGYRLCAHKNELQTRADGWLWGHSIFRKLNGFAGTREEDSRIVMDSLERYPVMHIVAAVRDSVVQFFAFRTGDQIEPQEWALFGGFRALIPNQMHDYMAARQQRGLIRFRVLNMIHVTVGMLSIAAMVFLMIQAAHRARWSELSLPAFILLALIGNAIICATFSNPHDRYQSRVIWLPSLVLLLALARDPFALREPEESGT